MNKYWKAFTDFVKHDILLIPHGPIHSGPVKPVEGLNYSPDPMTEELNRSGYKSQGPTADDIKKVNRARKARKVRRAVKKERQSHQK